MKISAVAIFASVLVLCLAMYTDAVNNTTPSLTTGMPTSGPVTGSNSSVSSMTTKPSPSPNSTITTKMSTAASNMTVVTGTQTTQKPVITTSGALYNVPSVIAVFASVVAMLLKACVQ